MAATSPAPAPSASRSRYLDGERFELLDGLRALAILAVVGSHVGGIQRGTLLDQGLGVGLFFTLSGFLITRGLLREQRLDGAVDLRRFHVRRALRILPLYYAVLGIYVVLVWWVERDSAAGIRFFGNLPYFATFTSNFFVRPQGKHDIFYFAWSLATQEQFYLLWPLLVRYARSRWAPPLLMGSLGVLSEAWPFLLSSLHLAPDGVLGRAAAATSAPICLGAVAAYLLESRAGFAWAERATGRAWSLPAIGAALAVPSLADLGAGQFAFTSTALVLLVVACVVRPGNLLRPLLVLRPIRYLGSVSYGVYLLHMLGLHLARQIVPRRGPSVTFLLGMGITLAAAGLSQAWFERPILEAGRRWLQGRARPSPAFAPSPRTGMPPGA